MESERGSGGRSDDVLVQRLDQKFEDFLARYEADQRKTDAWRNYFDTRLAPIEKAFESLRAPWRIFIWFLGLSLSYPVYSAGKWLSRWVGDHFR